jgi:hypothetical protein
LLIGLLLLSLSNYGQSEKQVVFAVVKQEKRQQTFRSSHFSGLVDWKVTFRLTNNLKLPLVVYGSRGAVVEGKFYENKLNPSFYLLDYDKQTKVWTYPETNNKPLKWKKRSSLYKEKQILQPSEFIEFDIDFSTETDGGRLLKMVTYTTSDNKAPKETQSTVFEVPKIVD